MEDVVKSNFLVGLEHNFLYILFSLFQIGSFSQYLFHLIFGELVAANILAADKVYFCLTVNYESLVVKNGTHCESFDDERIAWSTFVILYGELNYSWLNDDESIDDIFSSEDYLTFFVSLSDHIEK